MPTYHLDQSGYLCPDGGADYPVSVSDRFISGGTEITAM